MVSNDITLAFRLKLIAVLEKLPFRSFDLLRQDALKILKELNEPLGQNTCSKNWWFGFLKKNPDIKKIWEDVPLERTLMKANKQAAKLERMHQSPICSTNIPSPSIISPTSSNYKFPQSQTCFEETTFKVPLVLEEGKLTLKEKDFDDFMR